MPLLLALLLTAAPTAAEVSALVDSLGSPDPAMRDEHAYSTFLDWIYQSKSLSPAEVDSLADRLLKKMRTGDVLSRSFSALILSIVAARDSEAPFLSQERYRELWSSALEYLRSETDLRGYDPKLGWVHATAHTADLLKFLARGRYFQPADQRALYDAISSKLRTAEIVFIYGEDERLARTVLAVIKRADFDAASFGAFISALVAKEPVSVAGLRTEQNAKNFCSKLAVLLDEVEAPSPAALEARKTLLAALNGRF
jgi:hypothetical protein